jgi:hypothetical protein
MDSPSLEEYMCNIIFKYGYDPREYRRGKPVTPKGKR